ncbi:cation:proton antiporter [Thalassorhabdus alkalitolerans]|uniref:Cation:proton antiporter n=1 Tax=Thalassorhabdus alkalitolerans TaxID=2282697 RepID=A0ABW0YUQ5_9BACI
MDAQQVFALLCIGFVLAAFDKKKEHFPLPLLLLAAGILCSFVPFFSNIEVTRDLIFDWFLPALLFVAAYQFPYRDLKKDAGLISTLATIGLLLTFILLGISLYILLSPFLEVSLVACLLIAAMLTPTDPVSVVTILKQTGPQEAADIVEGESLLNDGTSIVLFTLMSTMYFESQQFSINSFLIDFLLVTFSGAAIGLIIAFLANKWMHLIKDNEYHIFLSLLLAYISFYIAESLQVSGILATVAAGLFLSRHFHVNGDKEVKERLDGFWGIIELLMICLVFLLIGIAGGQQPYISYLYYILAGFLLMIAARYIVLALIMYLIPFWRHRFHFQDYLILGWGGMKGTISLALLLGLNAGGKNSEVIFTLTFGIVFLSIFIQSLTMYPITRKLKAQEQKKKESS